MSVEALVVGIVLGVAGLYLLLRASRSLRRTGGGCAHCPSEAKCGTSTGDGKR